VPSKRMSRAIASQYEVSSFDPQIRFDNVAHNNVETGSDRYLRPLSLLAYLPQRRR
jgi:hypothetical protein